ncbi:uncharacterized protein LOC123877658 [Maniola jurtina]|uniref:uncharacterized protein LOC123877658 n=1 Tax=Maniola jurtina TaxID=191418 RepID=UPI001E68CFDA|nr:uncharacterized protein LOC123877658 [Maniola jurtina]XP_045780465.1 uncharacterized protein LOC123877658 [Maniola jurtina]
MAKFIKSFFNTTERRKNSRFEENEEDKSNSLPLGRKLSISRSGRMKQAIKKRHSLSLDVYNQETQIIEKPKNAEVQKTQRPERPSVTENNSKTEKRHSLNVEEEIDTAFEIINKTTITDL